MIIDLDKGKNRIHENYADNCKRKVNYAIYYLVVEEFLIFQLNFMNEPPQGTNGEDDQAQCKPHY